jgi:hypothetical protein
MKSRPLSIPRAIRLAFEIISIRGPIRPTLCVALEGAISHNNCVGSVSASLNAGTESFASLRERYWTRHFVKTSTDRIICLRQAFADCRQDVEAFIALERSRPDGQPVYRSTANCVRYFAWTAALQSCALDHSARSSRIRGSAVCT